MRGRIHLIAPAGSLTTYLGALGFSGVEALVACARAAVGTEYDVTANEEILAASENERSGGRTDDIARARDIENALGDDNIVALVALRGGAWLTRILPRINFGVLDRRSRGVAVLGFSELTTLVNIVGAHPKGLGVYELSPAFLAYGLRRALAGGTEPAIAQGGEASDALLRERILIETRRFFENVAAMIEGRRVIEPIACSLVCGKAPEEATARFVGGNLTVMSTLVGSRYADAMNPSGHWILIEDFNDKTERFDRLLAHLTVAGFWEQCKGVLIGDFHHGNRDLKGAMVELFRFHLPDDSELPVLVTGRIGHVWPMAPLPLHRTLPLSRGAESAFSIDWAPEVTRII